MNQAEKTDTDDHRPECSEVDFSGGVRGKYAGRMAQRGATAAIACRQQDDGTWHAYLAAMPSVQAYAETRESAITIVESLAAAAINSQRAPGDVLHTKLDFILVDIDAPTQQKLA